MVINEHFLLYSNSIGVFRDFGEKLGKRKKVSTMQIAISGHSIGIELWNRLFMADFLDNLDIIDSEIEH